MAIASDMLVRVFFVLAALLTVATPAGACPRGALCLATPAHVEAPARTTARLQFTLVEPRVLDVALRQPVVHAPDSAMPWIWQVLKDEVYSRMPRYEKRRFEMVLSPVVVSGTFDTVPGIGLEGAF